MYHSGDISDNKKLRITQCVKNLTDL